ncbi:MAG: hypothetical protein Q7R40_02570 [Phaeospirillum sp.]|nr:hypothetical protein [Phaeospirillum sp.]
MLARTLAELPDIPEPPPPSPPPPLLIDAAPRRSLMHRILGRRTRRAAMVVEPLSSLEEKVPADSAPTVFEDVAAPVEEPAAEPDDDDVLLLDQEVEDVAAPVEESAAEPDDDDVLLLDQEVEDVAAPVEESAAEPDDDDVLLLDQEVEDVAAPVEEPAAEPDDDDVLLLDQEVEDVAAPVEEPAAGPVVMDAIPISLTSAPFGGDRQPGLLERLFSRHRSEPPAGGPIRIDPLPLAAPPPTASQDEDEGVMLLDDSFMVAGEPQPQPPVDVLLQQVFDALNWQAAGAAPVAPAPPVASAPPESDPAPIKPSGEVDAAEGDDDDDDVLVLDVASIVEASPPPPPASEPPGDDMTADGMVALIAAATPDGIGTLELPDQLDSLAKLLRTPSDDFTAQDLLHDCWPRGSVNVSSRALLAVAINLSRNFGLPGKLPMAASKAWRMLDPQIFQAALAQRLAAIGDFIFAWQRAQFTFLSLEFGEIELIEYLFEALHPGYNTELLASVMNFKVLSGRRIGLLRRIPGHARRMAGELDKGSREQSLIHLAHVKSLLVRLAEPDGFPPIVDAAAHALIEVEKLMKQVANPPALPSAEGHRTGLQLGKL